MISGVFHAGSGLGDQLFRYITVRTLAEEKGYEWGMVNPGGFKGGSFLSIDMGTEVPVWDGEAGIAYPFAEWHEKDVRDAQGNDIRSYDPESQFVEDNTIIDGSFEDSKYWGHNLENINKWLAVEPLEVPDTTCVIGFRGGEYYSDPNLGLPKEYFDTAVQMMGEKNYQIHTDDPQRAREFWGPVTGIVENERLSHSKHSNMGYNWRAMRYSKFAIIPNSAFFILPRLLKHHEDPTAVTIAPRYWARRNTKVWARPACFYRPFLYI